jgi:hypothetical protein
MGERSQSRGGRLMTLKWQSIETAPADFTEVIVYDPRLTPSVFTARCFEGIWGRSSGDISAVADDFYGDDPLHPTHWMPLPLKR